MPFPSITICSYVDCYAMNVFVINTPYYWNHCPAQMDLVRAQWDSVPGHKNTEYPQRLYIHTCLAIKPFN